MNRLLPTLVIFCLLASSPIFASEKGKALYQTCIACHGASGEGNKALKAPALAGQQQAYLQRQLEHFKNGVRGADAADVEGAQIDSDA